MYSKRIVLCLLCEFNCKPGAKSGFSLGTDLRTFGLCPKAKQSLCRSFMKSTLARLMRNILQTSSLRHCALISHWSARIAFRSAWWRAPSACRRFPSIAYGANDILEVCTMHVLDNCRFQGSQNFEQHLFHSWEKSPWS